MSTIEPPLRPGALVGGRFRVEELIGEGGFGAVYRATQLAFGRAVALKVILPEALGPDGVARFQREAMLVQRLEHPNTVRVIDFGSTDDGAPFLVFELLRGRTLADEMKASGPMSAARVAHVGGQILRALMEAHGLGIVHRDLKPENVFLCDFPGATDFVKVLDFGVAKGADSMSLTGRGVAVGTPAYMAPEQIIGPVAIPASDLFAVGLLLSELLAGRSLCAGLAPAEIARERVSPVATWHPAVVLASPLAPVILRATEKEADRRHPSAAEMLAHLEAAVGQARASTPIPGTPAPAALHVPIAPAPRLRKKGAGPPWALFAAIGGALSIAAVTLAVTLGRDRGEGASPARSSEAPLVEADGPEVGTTRVSAVTPELLMERANAAGYEVTNRSTTTHPGFVYTNIAVRKAGRFGVIMLMGYDKEESAATIERSTIPSDIAVRRDGATLLEVRMDNGGQGGNGASRRLMRILLR